MHEAGDVEPEAAVTTGSHGPRRSGGRRAAPRRAAGRRSRAVSRRAAPPDRASGAGRAGASGQADAAESTTQLTPAGGLLTVLGCVLTGALLDGMFGAGFGLATWFGFVAGCVTATIKIRRSGLIVLVVSAPLVFVVAMVIGQTIRLWGSPNWLRTEVIGLATALSEGAPWLFVGTGAVVLIAWARGLRENLRNLRAELRGGSGEAPSDGDDGDTPEGGHSRDAGEGFD